MPTSKSYAFRDVIIINSIRGSVHHSHLVRCAPLTVQGWRVINGINL